MEFEDGYYYPRTVGQLREVLAQLPDDATVLIAGWDNYNDEPKAWEPGVFIKDETLYIS